MAEVQLLSLDRLADLEAAGCPDRTLEPTLSAFEDLLQHSVMFGDLTGAELAAAREAAPRAKDLVRRFWDCGIPDTVSHGDLHPGNVACTSDELRIFDWTDAAVSHPFLDAAHFARSALGRQPPMAAPRLAMDLEIAAAFIDEWRAACPAADVDTAIRLAPFVDQLYQAISYEGIYRAVEPDSRWELAGVVEQFLRGLPATLAAVD
jgi:aminoglycoside phosphotransferase (APT) family kinase protein